MKLRTRVCVSGQGPVVCLFYNTDTVRVLTAVNIKVGVLSDVMVSNPVYMYLCIKLHGVTYQKTKYYWQ